MKGTSKENRFNLKLTLVFILLGICIASMVIFYLRAVEKERFDNEYRKVVIEQSVLSQEIAKSSTLAAEGNSKAFDALKQKTNDFNNNMKFLAQLDEETNTIGLPDNDDPSLSPKQKYIKLDETWTSYRRHVNTILNSQQVILLLREYIDAIGEQLPEMRDASNDVAELLVQNKASLQQVYIASRQLMLIERISGNISVMMVGRSGAAEAAQAFGLDTATYKQILDALLKGDSVLKVKKVKDEEVREILREIAVLYEEIKDQVKNLLERSPETFEINSSAMTIFETSDNLLNAISELEKSYIAAASEVDYYLFGHIAAISSLVMFMLIAIMFVLEEQHKAKLTERQRQEVGAQNERNEQAIMRLLDEMGGLADGDLTSHASVTEDITGAIADSINYAIDALRTLVSTINETTVQVSSAAHETQATAMHLAEASEQQAQQITAASKAINQMANSIEEVSKNANVLANEAKKSVSIAKKGSAVVQDSIAGMDTIRGQIQETSKRIKRLGESSQEIGDIVEIINDISEQTNILALNAAIQAAMAGDAGRGFAVVADEVQRLAERSGDATKRIEALVKTIQADTNEAVISMERSTLHVVEGAKLAENAGGALEEIENVSDTLAKLIAAISNTTKQQALAATNISASMDVVQEITTQTSAGTNETAASIGNLAELANSLRQSVAGFKLPM